MQEAEDKTGGERVARAHPVDNAAIGIRRLVQQLLAVPCERALEARGYDGDLRAEEYSSITMSGGSVGGFLATYDDSSITMSGGSAYGLVGRSSSPITWSGGSVESTLGADLGGSVEIIGTNFMVDGIPVPDGDLTAGIGTLTGTLLSGDSINNIFIIGSSGTITLIPEPTTALLLACGLAALAAARRRRS